MAHYTADDFRTAATKTAQEHYYVHLDSCSARNCFRYGPYFTDDPDPSTTYAILADIATALGDEPNYFDGLGDVVIVPVLDMYEEAYKAYAHMHVSCD